MCALPGALTDLQDHQGTVRLKNDLHTHVSHVMRLSQSTSAIKFATQTKLDIGRGLLRFRVPASVGVPVTYCDATTLVCWWFCVKGRLCRGFHCRWSRLPRCLKWNPDSKKVRVFNKLLI